MACYRAKVSASGALAFVAVLAAVAAVAACGDNIHPSQLGDAARADTTSNLLPDLAAVPAQMDGTLVITNDTFAATDCEIVEGCVGAVGSRRLLRFTAAVANLGTADLDLGPTPPPGVSEGIFVWSPCHMHHHIAGFADFELWDATQLIVAGHKQGFCIEDDEQVAAGGPSHHYNCTMQGITVGWADVYARGLPCQWIDISDVAPGTYTLRVVFDVGGVLPDSDPTNNTWMTTVAL